MQEFFPFFIILLVAVIFSQLFVRMRIPWVVALIIGGIVFGPNGIGLFTPNETIDFLAAIGLIFLMFMAGAESKLSEAKELKKDIVLVGCFIGILPTAVGILVALLFGYDMITAVLMGIIFMSSAIAMLIPQFQAKNIMNTRLVRTVVASTVIIDAVSLVLLSIFLQVADGGKISPISLVPYLLAAAILLGFAKVLPRLSLPATSKSDKSRPDMFERELRFTVMVLIGLVVFFEFVGLHAIVAGFFGGMILSKFLGDNPILKAKIHAISYGFFVPVFFVVIGASTDLSVFIEGLRPLMVTAVIIITLMLSKFAGGWIGGRLSGFDNSSSTFVGVSALPQLSTTLAVAFLGFGEGILDQTLLSALIGLVIVTSITAPLLVNMLTQKAPEGGSSEGKTAP